MAAETNHASLGQSKGGEGEGLRVLRPISDGDEQEEGEEEEGYEGAREGGFDEEDGVVAGVIQGRDLDVRNRKWRRRIEQALVKMTTEVAALREQLEVKSIRDGRRRNGIWAWVCWLLWVTFRHLVVDLAILGGLIVWARRKGDRRVERGLELLLVYVREKIRRARMPEVLRRLAQQS